MSKLKIPESWAQTTLGEVGTTMIGLTYSPSDISEKGIPVLRSGNIQKGKIDLNDLVRVNKKIKENLIIKQGDIVICARNGSKSLVGKAAQVRHLTETMTFGAFMAIYRSQINDFVEKFFNSQMFRDLLEGVGTSTINQITQNNLKSFTIPIPPLKEQQRIVEKIESTQEKIKTIELKISKSEELIETLALSFLKNFEGVTLGDFYEERVDRFAKSSEKNTRMIGVSNERGVVALRTEKKVDKSKYKWVQRGDVFYNPMRLNVGSVALYLDDVPAITSPEYVVVRPRLLGGGWLLFHYLRSKRGQEEIKKRTKGSVRERVYFKNLSTLPFAKIDDSNQKKLANAETLLTVFQVQINFLRDNLLKLEKVILEKAFSGELVSQKTEEGTGQDFLDKINKPAIETVKKTFNKANVAKKITTLPSKKKVRK